MLSRHGACRGTGPVRGTGLSAAWGLSAARAGPRHGPVRGTGRHGPPRVASSNLGMLDIAYGHRQPPACLAIAHSRFSFWP